MSLLAKRVVCSPSRRVLLHHGVKSLANWSNGVTASRWNAARSYNSTTQDQHQQHPYFLEKIVQHNADALALMEPTFDRDWTYSQLLSAAESLKHQIQAQCPSLRGQMEHPLRGEQPRIAFLGSRGASYVVIQWAIWLLGGIAVPLHPKNPINELEYILSDADVALVIASESLVKDDPAIAKLVAQQQHTKRQVITFGDPQQQQSRQFDLMREEIDKWAFNVRRQELASHIVYTSGTTGRPKGVVTTHANATAQITDIVTAWEMNAQDHLLHFLPLHHVHGIVNNLLCVHYAGGSVEFIPSAKANVIWSKLAQSIQQDGPKKTKPVSMLMAVPTVYMNMLEEMERMEASRDDATKRMARDAVKAARAMRVTISGSMACPISIYERWQKLTGHVLLERYGMTELGMALTNPLHGTRHPGYVGMPFPSVSCRLVDTDTEQELELKQGNEGELRVKGANVFREYWRRPEATSKEFDQDGWFKTGDIAEFNDAKKSFRIRGRASADIIKSGGYKISALDIERVLLTHPNVRECAVFGLPDEKFGQIVSAVVRVDEDSAEDKKQVVASMRQWVGDQLAKYRVPRKYFIVDAIPKNAMGKVNKKQLATLFVSKQAL